MTAVMDLAIYHQTKPVTLSDIAARQGIPHAYLGHLFAKLKSGGLVKSQRGPSGGYVLACPPEDISLSDILEVVDEEVRTMRCGGETNCQAMQQCLSHNVWQDLGEKIQNVLAGISVADMIKGASVDRVIKRQMTDWEQTASMRAR